MVADQPAPHDAEGNDLPVPDAPGLRESIEEFVAGRRNGSITLNFQRGTLQQFEVRYLERIGRPTG